MQIFLCGFCLFVETDALDPSGLVSAGFEGQGEGCDRIALAPEEDFRVVSEIAGQYELIDHRGILLSLRIELDLKAPDVYGMDGISGINMYRCQRV